MSFFSHFCHAAAQFTKGLIQPWSELLLLLVLEGKGDFQNFFLGGKGLDLETEKGTLVPTACSSPRGRKAFITSHLYAACS